MTLDTITKIIHLRAAKMPQHKIARQIGVCTRTVLRVLKKHAHEFALRDIEVMEAVFEKSGITCVFRCNSDSDSENGRTVFRLKADSVPILFGQCSGG